MKKPALHIFFCFILGSCVFYAQGPTYDQLLSIVKEKSPKLDCSNKIIAISVWSVSDSVSRATNKEFEKVAYTFHYSRLKNGSRGNVVISCSADDRNTAAMSFQKDGIWNSIPISRQDYPFLRGLSPGTNIVYDNTAQKVYENLAAGTIFKSYNQLITR